MLSLKKVLLVGLVTLGGLAAAAPAHALTCNPSHVVRNQIAAYSAASDWDDLEDYYLEWVALDCPSDVYTSANHFSAAVGAYYRGDLVAAIARDNLSGGTLDLEERVPTMFGWVDLRNFRQAPQPRVLSGPGSAQPTFLRAANALSVTGRYGGYMRPGTYTVSGRTFTVVVGQSVTVTY